MTSTASGPSRARPRLRAVLVLILLAAVGVVVPTAGQSALADASSLTVTGPGPAWDAVNGKFFADLPTATVSQTSNLLDQTVTVSWTHFTPSSLNEFDPTPQPGTYYQAGSTLYPVWVVECRGTDPQNDLLTTGQTCYTPENGRTDGASGVGNGIHSVTQPDGSGSVAFHVENAETNGQLGCDPTHPCSIVVVPAFGGRQNPNNPIDCADHSLDYPNAANGYDDQTGPAATDAAGSLGMACSWANRLVLPLSFAPTPTNCPATNPAFAAAGSPMLARALSQWQAGWCRGPGAVIFDSNSTSNEYQARAAFLRGSGALTANTDVALTTQPVDGTVPGARRFTYAPIANTAIVVAFVVDDPQTGAIIPNLVLNARLVAKLLTQSYAPTNYACLGGGSTTAQSISCDPAIKGNPASIFADPEFLKLNPGLTAADFPYVDGNANGAFFPTVVSGDSDLTYELTSWIANDADARAFLQGQDDPWGMHVNNYYRGVHYPVSALEELDPGFVDPTAPPGNGTMQNSWQPVNGLDQVSRLLVGNTSTALNAPVLGDNGTYSVPRISESIGARSLFAVLDAGQAAAYAFPTAALVNAAGDPVSPTTSGLAAGVASMAPDANGITEHPTFGGTSATAYPLTVTDYAMVPTCGVSASTAAGITGFLGRVADSQVYGLSPGTLAPGYLTLTDPQLANLSTAQSKVSDASCTPPPTRSPSSSAPAPSITPAAVQGGGGGSDVSGGTGPAVETTTAATTSAAPAPSSTPAPTTATTPLGTPAAFAGGPRATAGPLRLALPVLVIAGAALLFGGPGLWLAMATGAGPAVTRRLRRGRR